MHKVVWHATTQFHDSMRLEIRSKASLGFENDDNNDNEVIMGVRMTASSALRIIMMIVMVMLLVVVVVNVMLIEMNMKNDDIYCAP